MIPHPLAIDEAITEALDRLEQLTDQLGAAGDTAAEARTDFELAFSRAFITADVTNEYLRRHVATVATTAKMRDREMAEARLNHLRAAQRALLARIDALRTIAVGMRQPS